MPKHDVTLDLHTKVVAHKDIEVSVRSDGSKLGTLLVSKGNIEWLPANNSVNKYRLTREKFADVMEEFGESGHKVRLPAAGQGGKVRVRFPQKDANSRIQNDQIGLHSSLCQRLFGKKFGEAQGGKPWERGVVTVVGRRGQVGSQKVRLLFRGGAIRDVSEDACLIAPPARQMLGIRTEGEEVTLIIEPQWYARALFFWNHPDHHARVAFK